ncbi:uncharacterized protein [Elaeis guineensis]|uniref:Uncharacterized protein LOC105039436 n=1 Tax=Elaeis guineensis var. tenera TaxID=51953 RepID=A0A6I9QTB8_ELAGV|nr:uncharacterized protein LOC105039436 [Elaeis guineensis]
MVKLATARESRMYGPHPVRNRWEYINAGLYVFAAILLVFGFVAQLPRSGEVDEFGLVVILIGLVLVVAVNVHDLVAHLAGIDYRFELMGFDVQLGLVEFAVPLVQTIGSILVFIAILFLLIQEVRGYNYRLEKHALNMLMAGPLLWVLGSIHNACQVYERSDSHTQILQSGVHVPFLMGSFLFLLGGIFNRHDIFGSMHHSIKLMAKSWIWLSIFGSLLFLIGGILNVVKVFKMQQADGLRLEKLRGGAQERLVRDREGRVPLILEDDRRRRQVEEVRATEPVPRA